MSTVGEHGTRQALLARALDYPYSAPSNSYCLQNGIVASFDPGSIEGRTPVLAIGSNRAPAQLLRKFGPKAQLPVQACFLVGYDVVYAARISGYGAIPATLYPVENARAEVAITWLDPQQLRIMHQSEGVGGGYGYFQLKGQRHLVTTESTSIETAGVYLATRGVWDGDGDDGPVGLGAVRCEGGLAKRATTPEMLERLRRLCEGSGDVSDFLFELISDSNYRATCRQRLGLEGLRPSFDKGIFYDMSSKVG